jgi:hypothetical protein
MINFRELTEANLNLALVCARCNPYATAGHTYTSARDNGPGHHYLFGHVAVTSRHTQYAGDGISSSVDTTKSYEMHRLTVKMKWITAVVVGICLSIATLEIRIGPLEVFNEIILRVVRDLAISVPDAIYYGLDYAGRAAGANTLIAALLAGLISVALLFGLLKLLWFVHKLRIKEPSQSVKRIGDIAYWLGCMWCVYFLCGAVLVTSSLDVRWLFHTAGALSTIGWIVCTAILSWWIGYSIRYLLSR